MANKVSNDPEIPAIDVRGNLIAKDDEIVYTVSDGINNPTLRFGWVRGWGYRTELKGTSWEQRRPTMVVEVEGLTKNIQLQPTYVPHGSTDTIQKMRFSRVLVVKKGEAK